MTAQVDGSAPVWPGEPAAAATSASASASDPAPPAVALVPLASPNPVTELVVRTGERKVWPAGAPRPPGQFGERRWISFVAGVLVGLLIFGSGSLLLGRYAVPSAGAQTSDSAAWRQPTPRADMSLPPYEQAQLIINRPKFTGDLAPFVRPWLPWMSACIRSDEKGGPKPSTGEAVRVNCSRGGIALYFVQYQSVTSRDSARARYLARNRTTNQLAPGCVPPAQKETTSGSSSGSYIEFAYRASTGAHAGQVVAGVWWDNATTPVAAYITGYWVSGLGANWAGLRDLWTRLG